MKNKEVLEFAGALEALNPELTGRVFTHAVALNQQKLEPFVKALDKAQEASEDMKEYLKKFEDLKKHHSNKDEHGNPVIKMGNDPRTGKQAPFYDIPGAESPTSDFFKAREALIEKYKATIETHGSMIKEWHEELLNKESEFEPTMIDLDGVPEEINTTEMRSILFMINE